jgi:hypothetical protein
MADRLETQISQIGADENSSGIMFLVCDNPRHLRFTSSLRAAHRPHVRAIHVQVKPISRSARTWKKVAASSRDFQRTLGYKLLAVKKKSSKKITPLLTWQSS